PCPSRHNSGKWRPSQGPSNQQTPSHRRAIKDILDCRTAALGGQVWHCEACNTQVFSYHSCVMGKFRNGELAAILPAAKPRSSGLAPHYAFALSKAMSRSGGRKDPLRRCGGTSASMASSFSVGSPRV